MSNAHADGLIPSNDPAAVELLLAVRGGDVGTIMRLISEHPDLPRWQIGEPNCHGGQRRMAEYLLDRGASIDFTPDYSDSAPVQVAGQPDTMRQALVTWLTERGASQE